MFAGAELESRLPDLQDQLGRAQVVTPDLMSKVVAGACNSIAMPSCADKAAKIDRLIESEAWTEAALALVELELPQWRLHRLVYEEDAWLCSLSKQWNVRVWLADCAETRPPIIANSNPERLDRGAAMRRAVIHAGGKLGPAMRRRIKFPGRNHVLRQLCVS
jgi:hypothetical protein